MRHIIIPDCQIRKEDNTDFLEAIGNYIVSIKPDVVVCLGDFADMPSLSSYDVGKKSFEGASYTDDVHAATAAMYHLLKPLYKYNINARLTKHKTYNPRMVMTLGNHENRINKVANNDPKFHSLISTTDLMYESDWEVFPFLDVVVIDGVAYSHYFVTGVAGRAASSAAAQFRKTSMSCVAGHQQGLQIHTGSRADGKRLTSVIAGSCYEHNEDYLGPQGNKHWRGVLVLNDVNDGEFDLMPVSLSYLKKKFL